MSGAESIIPFLWAASSVTCAYLTSFAEDNPNHPNNDEKNEETTGTTQPTRIVMPTAMRLDSPPYHHHQHQQQQPEQQQQPQDDGAASLATMETAELSLNFSWSVDSSAFAPYSYNEDMNLVDSVTPRSAFADIERSSFQS